MMKNTDKRNRKNTVKSLMNLYSQTAPPGYSNLFSKMEFNINDPNVTPEWVMSVIASVDAFIIPFNMMKRAKKNVKTLAVITVIENLLSVSLVIAGLLQSYLFSVIVGLFLLFAANSSYWAAKRGWKKIIEFIDDVLTKGKPERVGIIVNSGGKCPRCGNTDIFPIKYGYPTPEAEKLNGVTHILGGCVVEPNQPQLYCKNCKHRF